MADPQSKPVSNFRIILAAILDLLTSFLVIGYIIALITGDAESSSGGPGFNLKGGPAFLLFGLVIAYFVIGNRTGGTLWKRILKVPAK